MNVNWFDKITIYKNVGRPTCRMSGKDAVKKVVKLGMTAVSGAKTNNAVTKQNSLMSNRTMLTIEDHSNNNQTNLF